MTNKGIYKGAIIGGKSGTKAQKIIMLILSMIFLASCLMVVITPILLFYVEGETIGIHLLIFAPLAIITGFFINRMNKKIFNKKMDKERQEAEKNAERFKIRKS